MNPIYDVPIPGSLLDKKEDKYILYKSIVQIIIERPKGELYGTRFFIKFMKNRKPFLFNDK